MTDEFAPPDALQILPDAPWLRRFPVRTPTLPPATHTNVYVIGEGALLVVDPASPYRDQQDRLSAYLRGLSAEGHRITALFLTHHHLDHVSGAKALSEELSVPIWSHRDTAVRVSRVPGISVGREIGEGDTLEFGPRGLTAVHTPGHAPGHLCLVDQAGGGAVVGDMVASIGTIIVDPDDDGDMGLYLDSLARLQSLGVRRLWPAHGAAVEDGPALLGFYVRHRLMRESKVVQALQDGRGTLATLLERAYDDTPRALHPLARRSLLAHLRKLEKEGRASMAADGTWYLVTPDPDRRG